jgi:hypothetical protein
MTRNPTPNLNATDRADVKAREFLFGGYSEGSGYDRDKLDRALRDASFGVRFFDEEIQLRWLILGADHISLGYFSPETAEYSTRSELHAAFEKEAAYATEEHKEWIESKGEVFDPAVHHPWGAGVEMGLQKWFDVSPYTLWRINEDCVGAGTETLRDDVESILDGSEGTARIADKMREKFEDSMKKWMKDNG